MNNSTHILPENLSDFWATYAKSPVPSAIFIADGSIVKYNNAMEVMTGYRREELFPETEKIPRLFPGKENTEKFFELVDRIIEHSLEINRGEFLFSRKDGTICHVECSVYSIYRDGAPSDYYFIQLVNVTERKVVEEALKESEKIFRTLVSTAPDGIVMIDTDGRMRAFNEAFAKLHGYKIEEMIGRNFFDLYKDFENRMQAEQLFQYLAGGGRLSHQEIVVTTKAGQQIPVELSVAEVKDNNNVVRSFIAIYRDITERKITEEALRFSEQKYRDLVENISDLIYALDDHGIITYVSPTIEHLSDYTADEVIGKPFEMFIHPDDVTRARKAFHNVRSGIVEQSEYRVVVKNSKYFWGMTSSRPIFENGRFLGIHGILTDITGRKNAELELLQAKRELEIKTRHLEDTNTALKVILQHQEQEKHLVERNIYDSISNLIEPYIDKIRTSVNDEQVRMYLKIIDSNLEQITRPFTSQLSTNFAKLTPTEIQIADLIRENKSTKDIADILNISVTTVFFHRRNIRDKLGLKNNSVNLRSHIQSLAAGTDLG